MRLLVLSALSLFLVACSGSDGSGDPQVGGDDTVAGADTPYIPGEDTEGVEGDAKPVGGPDGGSLCEVGEAYCEDEDTLRTCLEDGTGWLARDCADGETCLDGACVVLSCEPGDRRCTEDGDAWESCLEDGTGWSEPTACEDGSACVEGVCLAQQCEPGEVVCDETSLLTCDEDGLGWTRTDCEEGQVCFAGQCLECVNADQCDEGETCDDGVCAPEPVHILPAAPPLGTVGETYTYAFGAEGGLEPYAWSIVNGAAPSGLSLSSEGVLGGQPDQTGDFSFTLQVEDEHGSTDTADVTVTVEAYVEGVRITSTSPLPNATEGEPYAFQLEVAGGTSPYAWMINSGELPYGLSMDATGGIAGTPDQAVGDFVFNVRVFDNSPDAPTWDQKEFMLTVEIAPLEIVGEQEYDLLVTKVIVLPLLTFIPDVPLLPYDTQLEARGGLRPYHWAEQPIPDYLSWLIPRGGLPEGLSLAEDGTLSGNVSSTEEVITIDVPFTQISLKGFFFIGRVEDSQDPAESKQALFLIPTLPIGG